MSTTKACSTICPDAAKQALFQSALKSRSATQHKDDAMERRWGKCFGIHWGLTRTRSRQAIQGACSPAFNGACLLLQCTKIRKIVINDKIQPSPFCGLPQSTDPNIRSLPVSPVRCLSGIGYMPPPRSRYKTTVRAARLKQHNLVSQICEGNASTPSITIPIAFS